MEDLMSQDPRHALEDLAREIDRWVFFLESTPPTSASDAEEAWTILRKGLEALRRNAEDAARDL
jgi:hypothetical protein